MPPRQTSGSAGGNAKGGSSSTAQSRGQSSAPTVSSVYKAYGGQHNFMLSMGIKPYDQGAYDECRQIAEMFLEEDRKR